MKFSLKIIISFYFISVLIASAAEYRTVTIPWKKVKTARFYELQLSKNPEMIPVILNKKTKKTNLKIKLRPGTFYFRVRGLDFKGRVGPWTQVEGFSVHSSVPGLLSPAHKEVIREELPKPGLKLEWEEKGEQKKYLLEIRDKKGVALKRSIEGNVFNYMPLNPGYYRWRIGYETPSGEEWGKSKLFLIKKSAIPEKLRTVKKIVYIDEMQTLKDEGNKSSFSVIARAAQALGTYAVEYRGTTSFNASAAPLIGVFSLEGRWKAARRSRKKWQLSGSVNLELVRPNYLGEVLDLFRGYTRVFFMRVNGRWRYGPFAHVSYGKGGIFVADSQNSVVDIKVKTTVTRLGLGAGFAAVYQASRRMYFSMLLMGRYDLGGTSDQTGNIDGNMGFEAGFGVVLGLSEKIFMEGRVRAQQENFQWTDPTSTGKSKFSQTFAIIDFGVGYHF